MAIRTVIECDACGKQESWEDMRSDALPDSWLAFSVREIDEYGDPVSGEQIRVTICGSHNPSRINITTLAKAIAAMA